MKTKANNYLLPFILVTFCFALWGFANDITNPMVKAFSKIFRMNVTEGALVQVAFTGRVVCIGYAKSEVAFQTKYFVQKELDIRGSRNAQPSDFRAVIHYLQRGTCPVDRLISGDVAPEGALEAMQQWAENPGKVFRILVHF